MRFAALIVMVLLALPVNLFAGGDAERCKTKYPIFLAHGMGGTDQMLGFFDYWYGIEEALQKEGAVVYTSKVNCMDNTEQKALQVRKNILECLAITGAKKVHYIGHSHGTIYGRYAISLLMKNDNPGNPGASVPLSSVIASYTSVSGVHRGSSGPDCIVELCKMADNVFRLPGGTSEMTLGKFVDFVYGYIIGDNNPHGAENCYALMTDNMIKDFNREVRDASGVYYQSYVSRIKWLDLSHAGFTVLWPMIKSREGDNDGCVSVRSATWPVAYADNGLPATYGMDKSVKIYYGPNNKYFYYKGQADLKANPIPLDAKRVHFIDSAVWASGVDHLNIIGHFFGITPGFDAPAMFVDMVAELKDLEMSGDII